MSTDYQKFIILSTHRSGTNLLNSLLNSHPNVTVQGECFRPSYFDAASYPSLLERLFLTMYRNIFPIQFLQSHIYGDRPKIIKAAGFELFYTHNRKGWLKHTWDYIRNNPDIKIIHLKRINLLRAYTSLRIAEKTNIWKTADRKKRTSMQIHIDYVACRQYFLATEAYRKFFDDYFRDHDSLSVTYEDLASKREWETKKILRFLHVSNQTLHTPLIKLNTKPLSEVIQNYTQLKQRFASTKWAAFFED